MSGEDVGERFVACLDGSDRSPLTFHGRFIRPPYNGGAMSQPTERRSSMHWSKKYVIVGGAIAALAAGGAATAIATGSEDEGGATGPGADQAKAAALKIYPGSHANSVERDSENGATWEVEVAKPD